MGGEANVIVAGRARLLARAARRIEDLEAKWTRFRPDSEISTLNGCRNRSRAVSADTRVLVERAITAWHATCGAFDPTIVDAIVSWGYDVDLDEIEIVDVPRQKLPAPGLGAAAVDNRTGTVCLGGVGFDPGGIGKGLAADLVATELVEAGATAALVNLAGDLRMAGDPDPGWVVGIEDPSAPGLDLRRLTLTGGGLASSSDRRRRWSAGTTTVHHLLDPRTGGPATTTLVGVTVLAGEAWWAEALTKAILVGGMDMHTVARMNASAIGRTHSGAVIGTVDLVDLDRSAA